MRKILVFIFLIFLLPQTGEISAAEVVDINTATLAQLDTLTGIGPVLGQRIIDARPYSSVDDLDIVKGIGPATLQKIKTQGLAYVSAQVVQSAQTPALKQTPPVIKAVSPDPGSDGLPKTQKSDNNGSIKAEDLMAGLSLPAQTDKPINPLMMFLVVLGLTLILATIVLFIKLKLNKHVRT